MISVPEARTLISQNNTKRKIGELPLLEALYCTLAESLVSPINSPPFNQSAMDGYAFCYNQCNLDKPLLVIGEVQAGNVSELLLKPQQAIRIFTGAPLPPGADTVVMQEKVLSNAGQITILDENLKLGSNVRLQGSQTKEGEMAMSESQLLTPAAISFLAGIGIDRVKVFLKPSVHIIVTGKELVSPGNSISDGEIFESNSFGIRAGLAQHFIQEVSMAMVDDNQVSIETCIQEALHCDVVILTGGVSVGDYDFVASALVNCGVKTVFHKVKQKPGKPFYFGKHGDTLLFGLPGNPASVMACFYEYVLPAIYEFMGKQSPPCYLLPLSEPLTKKAGLTHFLKGHTDLVSVRSLAGQESYLMNSFAVANCLIELEEEKEVYLKGDLARVRLIS